MARKQTVTVLDTPSWQAITTRYRGPTDSRGSRVIASCDAARISVPWDHALGVRENHAAAAAALMAKVGWNARLAMGSTKQGYVFVQLPRSR